MLNLHGRNKQLTIKPYKFIATHIEIKLHRPEQASHKSFLLNTLYPSNTLHPSNNQHPSKPHL
jgi:hypothetical protein